MEDVFLCKKCLVLSTRPRIQYTKGVCNACIWAEKKKNIDWNERWKQLEDICNKYRCIDGGNWDVIVPCSGGKDGSYVAWKLQHDLDMSPLCVTFAPQLQTELFRKNLRNFIASGFDHININPNPIIYRKFAKHGFITQGRPRLPNTLGLSLAIFKIAVGLDIPFIMYGEEGEEEYGGATTQIGELKINKKYLVDYYYSGHSPEEYLKVFPKQDLKWWSFPDDDKLGELFPTHWSHYENWDSNKHFKLAMDKTGLQTKDEPSVGTYTNYAQLGERLQDLSMYLMKLKFGFGRCWSDVCLDIRGGRMTRDEGIRLVKKYDGVFPYEYLGDYLNFFDMSYNEFWDTCESWRNLNVWKKQNDRWVVAFEIR